jgi:hypothetical protein
MSQQKWSPAKKATHAQMRYRRLAEVRLNQEIHKLRDEQKKYQEHFARRFKWWIKLMGDSHTPDLPWLVEQDAKFMQTVAPFTW